MSSQRYYPPSEDQRIVERLAVVENNLHHTQKEMAHLAQQQIVTNDTIHRMCMREITFTEKLSGLLTSFEKHRSDTDKTDLSSRVEDLEAFKQAALMILKWAGAGLLVLWAIAGKVNWQTVLRALLAWAG